MPSDELLWRSAATLGYVILLFTGAKLFHLVYKLDTQIELIYRLLLAWSATWGKSVDEVKFKLDEVTNAYLKATGSQRSRRTWKDLRSILWKRFSSKF